MSYRRFLRDPLFAGTLSWDELEDVVLRSRCRERRARLISASGRFDLASMDPGDVKRQLRFEKDDIARLRAALRMPDIRTEQRTQVAAEEALCLALRRLAYPNRLCDLEHVFGRHYSTLSLVSNAAIEHIVDTFGHLLTNPMAHSWIDLETFAAVSVQLQY